MFITFQTQGHQLQLQLEKLYVLFIKRHNISYDCSLQTCRSIATHSMLQSEQRIYVSSISQREFIGNGFLLKIRILQFEKQHKIFIIRPLIEQETSERLGQSLYLINQYPLSQSQKGGVASGPLDTLRFFIVYCLIYQQLCLLYLKNISFIFLIMTHEQTESNLMTGLDIVGQVMYNIREWTGKFAEEQHKHQYPTVDKNRTKVGQAFNTQLNKFKMNIQQCSLCLTQKPKNQFYMMCKCNHQYCYNCLNTYAISRIQDNCGVVCPQQDCSETMPLTSQIYKYLPDDIKLKYLNNRQARKKAGGQNICPRCLEKRHSGQCRFALKPGKIEYAYHYRQCSRCKTEVNLTEGKRRIICKKCGHKFCYFCGTKWKDQKKGENHICGNRGQVLRIEQQMKEKATASCANCAECCSCECCDTECNCCECEACRHCEGDLCCQYCFYLNCEECNALCCLWNIFGVPVRLVFTLLIGILLLMIFGQLIIIPILMIFLALMIGFTCGLYELACSQESTFLKVLIILCFPFTGFIACFKILRQMCETPSQGAKAICQHYLQAVVNVWVQCSPKTCIN